MDPVTTSALVAELVEATSIHFDKLSDHTSWLLSEAEATDVCRREHFDTSMDPVTTSALVAELVEATSLHFGFAQ